MSHALDVGERRACITGAGTSAVGRNLGRSTLDLTVDACLAAIEDAGLTRDDIDGLSSYPGGQPSQWDLQDTLRLNLNWYDAGIEGPAQTRAVFNAICAVASGQARHVLVYRTVRMYRGEPGWGSKPLGGMMQWLLPFHCYSASNWFALYGARFMHERNITREQLAWIAITCRQHAALNPAAVYRDPITLDDYMSAEIFTTPFCIYDYDAPVDGSVVFVVSARDAAADTRKTPVAVEAMSARVTHRMTWDSLDREAMWSAAPYLWERTSLGPGDVDVAGVYDGFSTITIAWLEALGLCPPGEVGHFVDGGANIGLGGVLPLNTGGGQLSAGRLHGFHHLHEVVLQLRGEGGDRQVPGAEVGLVAVGGGPFAACLLLTRGT